MSCISDVIKNNIYEIREKIQKAALRAGRDPGEITLVAVTKTAAAEMVIAAVKSGVTNFAENRVQELLKKMPLTGESFNWHMIGHLQTNKVKQILGKVSLIHSVDSAGLANEIQKKAESMNVPADVLIEVNVSGEQSKHGVTPAGLLPLIETVSQLRYVNVRGLMTIAPYTENPETSRSVFKRLKQLSIDIETEKIDNISMDILSMGMSNDFETAIEEGSCLVRIGRAIFNSSK